MLEYPRWKYILVSAVLLISLLFAVPNLFLDDLSLQVSHKDRSPVTATDLATIEKIFRDKGSLPKAVGIEDDQAVLRFDTDTEQYKARDIAKDDPTIKQGYVYAMSY